MWNKILTTIAIIAVLGTLGALIYVTATSKTGETFTEFYILGPEGKAENYPEELSLGEEGQVIIGIINREQRPVTYHVDVIIDGIRNNQAGPVSMENDMKWEVELSFVPQVTGDNQRVEFILYKNGEDKPYMDPLYLIVDVR